MAKQSKPMAMACFNRLFLSPPCSIMEWLDSLWAWVMSLLASFLALFTSVSEAPQVEPATASVKAAEVFEALAAQVPPMLVELPEAVANDAPPNI